MMTNDLNMTLPQRPGPHSGRLPKIVLLLLVALLLADLRQRYDVVIHTSRLNPPADKSEAAATQQ